MPELPEVETVRKELAGALVGLSVTEVRALRDNILKNSCGEMADKLADLPIKAVLRRGKFILFDFGAVMLLAHLRMTGKFVLPPTSSPIHKHDRVHFLLSDGSLLAYNDSRCFGTIEMLERGEALAKLAKLGVEPLSESFTPAVLRKLLEASSTPIKDFLLDQNKIAGVGNIYASEILFRARVDPRTPANQINRKRAEILRSAIKTVLCEALEKNGTTISDFRRVDEKTGEFQNFLNVYGKSNRDCPNCGAPVLKITQKQRSTFFCEKCQS